MIPLRKTANSDEILQLFLNYVTSTGLSLYSAQEEAILQVMLGEHVILNTPTGSGKSLVATALHFKGLCEGKRSYYTCPIKALVSEKFFALCELLGADNVGMLTGDASINRHAPVICCTAEILSQIALSEGEKAGVDYAIIDEFHYFSDKERGVHWQIPLLTLSHTTFLLMSATLGDTENIENCLEDSTGKRPVLVSSQERPVPLDYTYSENPLHETLAELVASKRSPVYTVNFTQRDCAESAQDTMSVNFCTKEEKKKIADTVGGFRFDTPYGKEVKRFVTHGIGLHHAGLLPKYRLLVERLAQEGLLKIIMGTDTLGVGVNVPIRTVLFTKLCKFDGIKTSILSVRDFKQIAGRAGRKGFDEAGSVVCQAPEHIIENKRAENRFSASGKKNKVVKKPAPTKNYVHWEEKTFQRLIEQSPEPLRSQFVLTHSMLLAALQSDLANAKQGYRRLIGIIGKSLETESSKRKLRRRSALLFKSLVQAGVISLVHNQQQGRRVVVNDALQQDFSLHHALSLFILDAIPLLDPQEPSWHLDVLSLVESVIEHPQVVLQKQVDKLKDQRMAELRAEGAEYEERMAALEKIEHPKPLRDFIYGVFNEFRLKHPWVEAENILPKSVAREMFETAASFNQYISQYGLQRSEGVLLRYLSSVYKTFVQSVPDMLKTEGAFDVEAFFRSLLARVDNSLISEWEQMLAPSTKDSETHQVVQRLSFDPEINIQAFRSRVRAEMHALVKALSEKDYEEAVLCIRSSEEWGPQQLEAAMLPYFEEHPTLIFDHAARLPPLTLIEPLQAHVYQVRQILVDPEGNNDWFVKAKVDFREIRSLDDKLITLLELGN